MRAESELEDDQSDEVERQEGRCEVTAGDMEIEQVDVCSPPSV